MGRIPQYKRLYELLRRHIEEGVYQEGDILPSENELCRIHGMTRPTVRHALNTLVHHGYIYKLQGKGSIVNQLPTGIGILSVEGTTSAIGMKNLLTRIIESPQVQKFPANFMFKLSETEIESGCITMKRLRSIGEQPIFIDVNYIPNINLPRFTSRNFTNKSLFNVLRRDYQIEITGGEQKIRAIKSDKPTSQLLKVKKNSPVLHIQRKMTTNRPGFYIYSSLIGNTDIHAIYGTF
jgi:GntR family transcriptional regulator/GntR family frlABCD operon transcriptional regulator